MRIRGKMEIVVEPRSSLCVGASYKGFADTGQSRDLKGRAFIPATALKGMMREQLEKLPFADPALIDNLFGKKASDIDGETQSGCLVFEDLYPQDDEVARLSDIRHGVTISRERRSAIPKRLYQREVFPFLEGIYFKGYIYSTRELTSEEMALLKMLEKMPCFIGAGKSSGLGYVRIKIGDFQKEEVLSSSSAALPGFYLLTVEIERKLRCSPAKTTTYLYKTLPYIPGQTLRGAIVKALDGNARKESALPENFRVSPAYPAKSISPSSLQPEGPLFPMPLTSVHPKHYEKNLEFFEDWAIFFLIGHEIKRKNGLFAWVHDERGKLLYAKTSGWIDLKGNVFDSYPTNISTHVAIERNLGRYKEGALWSYEYQDASALENGVLRYRALVHLRDFDGLKDLLSLNTVLIGGSRSKGFGKAKLRWEKYEIPEEFSLQRRIDSFNLKLREAAQRMGVAEVLRNDGFYWIILLASPVFPDSFALSVKDFLSDLPGEIISSHIRFKKSSGYWEEARVISHVSTVWAEGGVIFGFTPDVEKERFLPWAEKLELNGLGFLRYEGHGWVFFCHPWHVEKLNLEVL